MDIEPRLYTVEAHVAFRGVAPDCARERVVTATTCSAAGCGIGDAFQQSKWRGHRRERAVSTSDADEDSTMLAESSTISRPVHHDVGDMRVPLQDVLDALCHGIRQANGPGKAEEVARFTALEEEWRVSMNEQIPAEVRRLSVLGGAARFEALGAAKAGKEAAAEAALRRARDAVAGFSEPGVTLLADTLTEAVAAYVDYKAKRFPAARAGLERSLDAANRLLMDYQCEKMHLRRLHLVANLVRMGARNGEAAEAMDIASGLLSYMEGDDASWPLPGFEVASPIGVIPLEDRVTHSSALGGEIALVLSTATDGPAPLLMHLKAHLAGHATTTASACAPFRPLHQWLRLNWAYSHEGSAGFLSAARDFFAMRQPGSFWADAARLLDRFCAPLDLEDAANIRRTLATAFAVKPTGPASIRV